jgi:hypothetical protein
MRIGFWEREYSVISRMIVPSARKITVLSASASRLYATASTLKVVYSSSHIVLPSARTISILASRAVSTRSPPTNGILMTASRLSSSLTGCTVA